MIRRALPLFFSIPASLAACDNPVDESVNELPYLSEQETVDETDVGPIGDCACLAVGQTFRFDMLRVDTLNGEESPVAAVLNGIWEKDISNLELDILIDITAVSDTEVTTRIYNGARIDETETICSIEGSALEVVFPRDGCKLNRPTNGSAFNVYGGTQDFPKTCAPELAVKHVIPVVDARLEGVFASDCSAIGSGTVPTGALRQADLGKVCTCLAEQASSCGTLDPEYQSEAGKCVGCNSSYQALDVLLTNFGVASDACTTDAGDPAACLTASWSAATFTKPEACTP